MNLDEFNKALMKYLEDEIGLVFDKTDKLIMEDIKEWALVVPQQAVQWIGSLKGLCNILRRGGGSHIDICYFWIKLYGLFTEIKPYFGKYAEIGTGLDYGIYERIRKIESMFTEEELIFVEYQRHCRCHAFPYMLKVKVKKPKTDTSGAKISTYYKGKSIHYLKEVIDRIIMSSMEKYNVADPGDAENSVARGYAARINSPVVELYRQTTSWLNR